MARAAKLGVCSGWFPLCRRQPAVFYFCNACITLTPTWSIAYHSLAREGMRSFTTRRIYKLVTLHTTKAASDLKLLLAVPYIK